MIEQIALGFFCFFPPVMLAAFAFAHALDQKDTAR